MNESKWYEITSVAMAAAVLLPWTAFGYVMRWFDRCIGR